MARLTAIAAGSFLTLSFAPFSIWPIAFLCLLVLYGLAQRAATLTDALILGGGFGLGLFGSGASWIYIALPKQVGTYVLPPSISMLIVFAYWALFIAGACGIAHWLSRNRSSCWVSSAIFASTWVFGEWLRGSVLGGFTWFALGYAQIDGPLAGLAPVIGAYGLSWVSVFVSCLIFHIFLQRKGRLFSIFSVAGIFLIAWGLSFVAWVQPYGNPVSVRLLQPAIDQYIKYTPAKIPATLDKYYSLITSKHADLIVTPETALPAYWHNLPPNYIAGLSRFSQAGNSNILLGITLIQDGRLPTNNVVGILAEEASSFPRYEKFHILPYGEYMPIGFKWLSNPGDMSQGNLAAGDWTQPTMSIVGQKIGFLICNEAMFGEEVIRWMPDATVLVNPGNLAWFSDSLAPAQMLQIVRMRAAETGRPVLSAPNTGITAIINHSGKVSGALPVSVTAVLEGSVQGMQGRTPYSMWGNYLIIIFMFLVFSIALLHRRKFLEPRPEK